MEKWQEDHINKNMPQLLEYTRCHPKLLYQLKAVGVFSSADVSKIKSKSDKQEQAGCFYDIILTRTNGYIELLKALSECKQDGAAKVLLKGIPTNLLSKLQVRFLGKDHCLSELLEEKDILELNEKLKSLNLNEYITLISECNLKVVPLLKNTIPNPEKYYVPRHLVTRGNLNQKIFTTNCQDVFVFTDFTQAKLSQLAAAAKCHTASSRKQIERLTSRFILLEDARHWKDICDIAKDVPVHLIKYEEGKYLLTKTTGGSRILNQFLDYDSEGSEDCFKEDDAAAFGGGISLCICDLPGMGKSLLLANLARTFSECNPNTFTAFISLPTVAQFLQTKPSLNNFTLAMEVLANILAPTELSAHILALLLKTRLTPIYLYLDGLDEVPSVLLPEVKLFLNTMKNEEKWIRIHVTARTHMRHELETALGVIPYDIVPFTHDNKIQFLTNFWKNQDPSSNETRLAEFATHCLDKWKEHMKECVQITGIPLQCRLVAEVYSRHAHRYARESVQLNEIDITETSLVQLYNSYLQIGLARVENHILSSTMTQSQSIAEKLLAVEQFHIWQALKLLYPKMAESYTKHYSNVRKALEDGELETIMCMGFLVPDIGQDDLSVKFVHRTFAEFLTARFFSSILGKNQLAENINKTVINFEKLTLKYFFKKVAIHEITPSERFLAGSDYLFAYIIEYIHVFSSYAVMKFVNDELHNYSCFNSLVSPIFSNAVSANSCYGMMISTLVQKLPSILRVVKFALLGFSKFQLWWYRRYLSGYHEESTSLSRQECLLYISVQFANAAVARGLYDILSQICCLDLYSLHNDRTDDIRTPLHFAIRRGDYEIVEHVFQYSTSCDEGDLLRDMIYYSNDDSITVVQNNTTICQLLFSRSPFAINKLYDYLLKDPCLIKLLVQYGLQIGHEDRTRILELAAKKWSTDKLYEMFVFFNNNVNKDSSFKEINFPLLAALKYSLEATKLIPKIPNVQWDVQDEHGNTLIHMSAAGDESICIIEKCLENGAKLSVKNNFGWSGLHVAAAKRNVKLMYYLLEKGISITEKNDTDDTPLHLFFLNTRSSYKLLANMNLADLYQFMWKRYLVHTSTLNELLTNIFTSQQNEQVLQLLLEKNENGQTILHNFLYDDSKELKMSCETLAMMMDSLHIKVNETDNGDKNLLDAAIQGGQDELIIKLLRQKLADD